ncbi:MAG: DHA2 family efflux MFS transporter permease subunit [Bdellovibrionales bacterium]|nr:DHA2 family efflux MFS transporter permease subunit [Bdellovibrionales bacterium]
MKRDDQYKWLVLAIVMIGTLMSALDASIVNVSIPAIMADFGSSLDDIEWVITSYMLAFAALMPLTAWLRDRMGHKSLYIWSLVVFTVGSLFCGLAWNLPSMIVARVIQAIGGGAITPTGMAMITETFEPHERGKALGFWAMGAVMGPAFGPTIGGYLTQAFGWPSIFLVNLPIGLLGVFFALRILRNDKPMEHFRKPFDAAGFVFLAVFLVAFLLAMTKGESEGWTSAYIITCVVLAMIGLTGFLLVESLVEHGIMDLSLLRDKVFAACFAMTGVRSLALYGGTFLLPVFLQNFKGYDELQSGLILLPGSLLMGLLMPFGGRLGDKMSPRLMAFIGFSLLTLFFFEYRNLNVDTSNWGIIFPTLIRGVGVAMLIAPLTATAMNAVPRIKTGMASSMLNIIQQVGGSIGIAVLSLTLHRRSVYHLSLLGTDVSTQTQAYHESALRWAARAHELGYTHATSQKIAAVALSGEVTKASSILGFQDAFLVGAAMTLIVLLGVFYLPKNPPTHKSAEPIHLE